MTAATIAKMKMQIAITNQKVKAIRPACCEASSGSHVGTRATAVATPPAISASPNRLDSTNVIKPEVTAITSLSKDHMAQLGYTIAKIAEEKAGIFKTGVPAVTVMQDPGAEAVLKRVAEKVGAPLDVAGKSIEFSYRFESSRLLGPHNRICLTTSNSRFEHLAVPLLGEHQAINCGLALSVLDKLKSRGLVISDAKAMEGLSKTFVPGRMEM